MIYPTGRAVSVSIAAACFALVIAAVAPPFWSVGFIGMAIVICFLAADTMLSPRASTLKITGNAPVQAFVGRPAQIEFDVSFPDRLNVTIESTLQSNELLQVCPGDHPHTFELDPRRRGLAEIQLLWLRWRGPLGFVWNQHVHKISQNTPIVPDTKTIEEQALKILVRDNLFGAKAQIDKGEGAEFDALREFQAGMDTRSIDWKQTARHRCVLSKEFRTERNHSIVFAIDTGRLMCEPIKGGIARLDHALNAALLMTFISLKLGDRVGFFGFDAHPHLKTGIVSGARSFPLLRQLTAQIDYTDQETNYTLGLTELAGHLDRRTLVVVFTDFADTTSAELMLANLGTLLKRHLVVFVVFRDDELEGFINAAPHNADDVTKAVIADNLLKERELVISRLQQMGILVVDAPTDKIGVGLINQYLTVKRRNLL